MSPLPSVGNGWPTVHAMGGTQGVSTSNLKQSPSREDIQNHYHDPAHFEALKCRNPVCGRIINTPFYNKGTAFTFEERERFNLSGLLPRRVETIEQQVTRCLHQIRNLQSDLCRYTYLLDLKSKNETLFYRVVVDHTFEMLPYVYTPTVGEACRKYSQIYTHPQGLYVSTEDRGKVFELLNNWQNNHLGAVELIVVSDGSRILGLGDLGANGMGIPVGKSALYVAAGGFHPSTCLPVLLDTGTNNEEFLQDDLYLGLKQKRADDETFYALVDEFMTAVKTRWPQCLVQFEDFSNNHCFELLERYRNRQLCFNDDIQGTGAVVASGFLNALKLAGMTQQADVRNLRVLFLGAGSAGVGVAQQIGRSLIARYGISKEDCASIFYLVDSKGLVTEGRGDVLADFKKPFAKRDKLSNEKNYKDLQEIILTFKPQALIGLSGQGGQFTDEILTLMGKINKRPIVFPLSNPTKNSECTAEAAFRCTEGRVIFASGSPFPSVQVAGMEQPLQPSQGNNMYVFPGLGFGSWLGRCSVVHDDMLTAASIALADATAPEELSLGKLYPPLDNVRNVSACIAGAVIESAKKLGLTSFVLPPGYKDITEFALDCMFFPDYQPDKINHKL